MFNNDSFPPTSASQHSGTTTPIDDNTRLLRPHSRTNVSLLNQHRLKESSPLTIQRKPLNSRPVLVSVPSNHSLRSVKSFNEAFGGVLVTPSTQSQNPQSLISNRNTTQINYGTNNDDVSLAVLEWSAPRQWHWKSYVLYYLPMLSWIPKYDAHTKLLGDALAGCSLASFQIPLVMSLATGLANLPPIQGGVSSIVVASFTYAILGTVPVLVVGPSPSVAMIYGQLFESLHHDPKYFDVPRWQISAASSLIMGILLIVGGMFRLGFLDNVLSRSLLKGFVAAMGFIMIVSQIALELGIPQDPAFHPVSTWDKIVFVATHYSKLHALTTTILVITLILVLTARLLKLRLITKYRFVVYFPELLLMVIISTILSVRLNWESEGVAIVGNLVSKADVTTTTKSQSMWVNPFSIPLPLFKRVFSTAFLLTILGYFDHTTASKSLGAKYNYTVLSNRELIALGSTNAIIGLLGGLPSFGVFGRSKINIIAGASSPISTVIMGFVTIIAIKYWLPYLYYLPMCVLSLSTTIVGLAVLEEIPHDLKFFIDIGAYEEIITFAGICLLTIFWSLEAGVTVGVLMTIFRLIKHSSNSRIHVLGRVPHTTNVFRNADELIEESFHHFNQGTEPLTLGWISRNNSSSDLPSLVSRIQEGEVNNSMNTPGSPEMGSLVTTVEEIEGVLIVKIPEPLNFANSGDLRSKLARLEKYGTLLVHPLQPSTNSPIHCVIFDCKGMTSIDAIAIQTLYEIVQRYDEEGIVVCFTRISLDYHIRDQLARSGLIQLVNKNFARYWKTVNTAQLESPVSLATGLGEGFFMSIEDTLAATNLKQC
ncbi:uncharacterized protein KQ657_002237 [Scheffersomyces spartinae]|uniref:STAS domain-containing protein n=1 Tax=Scheffersomyces spartinae TaxID=45513 RepID=A0A9P7VDU7_9ASCO|nr:uncharacterized protein KQ657_002237 [Scheffersomyces spartinae]KAG7195852.1 hypothetical protein KQ657_002237 [Scheffersomyces spartinae]